MTHRPSTFFVSDTHFFHHNIIVFDETRSYRVFDNIESHNEELIARWNSVVHPKDTVWHLGDFSFGNKRNIAIAERLHGKKNLLLGNHDMHPVSEYLVYFNRVAGVAEYKGAILSHVPVHESQMTRYGAVIGLEVSQGQSPHHSLETQTSPHIGS